MAISNTQLVSASGFCNLITSLLLCCLQTLPSFLYRIAKIIEPTKNKCQNSQHNPMRTSLLNITAFEDGPIWIFELQFHMKNKAGPSIRPALSGVSLTRLQAISKHPQSGKGAPERNHFSCPFLSSCDLIMVLPFFTLFAWLKAHLNVNTQMSSSLVKYQYSGKSYDPKTSTSIILSIALIAFTKFRISTLKSPLKLALFLIDFLLLCTY